jgi:hypothetical protein
VWNPKHQKAGVSRNEAKKKETELCGEMKEKRGKLKKPKTKNKDKSKKE